MIGQCSPPPPVATGPGLDRPLFSISPEYPTSSAVGVDPTTSSSTSYTMARTRRFYHDQILEPDQFGGADKRRHFNEQLARRKESFEKAARNFG